MLKALCTRLVLGGVAMILSVSAADAAFSRTRLSADTKVVAGYWHNFNNGSSVMRLRDVPDQYNVVYVAFAESEADRATMIFSPSSAIPGQTTENFKEDVHFLQARGTKVILSAGGANAYVKLDTTAKKDLFVSSMIAILDEYDFDGFDVDIEAGTFVLDSGDTDFRHPTTATITNLIAGVREIYAHFGGTLMLTSAPETAYVQGAMEAYAGIWGAYMPFIEGVRDILDYVHPQYYNASALRGLDGKHHGPHTAGFLAAGSEALLKGFNVGGNTFAPLRPDQVAVGIPASQNAGGGFIPFSEVLQAVKYLETGNKATSGYSGSYTLKKSGGYPSFRGIMTWSVNWDSTTDGGTAVYEYANTFGTYFDTGGTPLMSIADASAEEGDAGTSPLLFPVTLSGALDAEVRVDYFTQDGSALAGTDYNAATGTLVFAVGETNKTISVGILGNTQVEGSKSFSVVLSNAMGVGLGDGSATGTILNDDSSGVAPPQGLSSLPSNRPIVIGYLNALRDASGAEQTLTPEQIETEIQGIHWKGYDIITHAFAEPLDATGTIGEGLGNFKAYQSALIAQAHAHGKSVLLSIGGAAPARISGQFLNIATDPVKRANFVSEIVSYLSIHGYDGVDIDWEFPDAGTGKAALTQLMTDLYAALKLEHTDYILMFGTGPGWYMGSYDFAALKDHCDFFFYFGYDWKSASPSGANGPIKAPGSGKQWTTANDTLFEQSVRGGLQYAIDKGFPANKIICGFPFYGSANSSWASIRNTWATNQVALDAAIDPNAMEVKIGSEWFTTPKALKMKMAALLKPETSVLNGNTVIRGVGTWEIGHEHRSHPDLSTAFEEWIYELGWRRHAQAGTSGNVSLESWKTTHGISDVSGDSDGNGLPDLIDFLAGNPLDGEHQAAMTIHLQPIDQTTNRYFTATLLIDPQAEGVEYRISESDNLSDWTDATEMILDQTSTNTDGRIRVVWRSAKILASQTQHKFARLTARSFVP